MTSENDTSGSYWTESSFVYSNCPFLKRQRRKSVRFDESVTHYVDDYQEPCDASVEESRSVTKTDILDSKKRKCCKHKRNRVKARNKRKDLKKEDSQKHFFCRHVWQGITR